MAGVVAMEAGVAAVLGRRILDEVEETSLDEILSTLRNLTQQSQLSTSAATPKPTPKKTFLAPLDDLQSRHHTATQNTILSLSGRYIPFLHALITHLVSPPQCKTLLVIDPEHRFDATKLGCEAGDRRHVHVVRPAWRSSDAGNETGETSGDNKEETGYGEVIRLAREYMLYAQHGSITREFWGTLFIGSPPPLTRGRSGLSDVDVTASSWKGWLRIDREEVERFPMGISAQEALLMREEREHAVESAWWFARSAWGGFRFRMPGGRLEVEGFTG